MFDIFAENEIKIISQYYFFLLKKTENNVIEIEANSAFQSYVDFYPLILAIYIKDINNLKKINLNNNSLKSINFEQHACYAVIIKILLVNFDPSVKPLAGKASKLKSWYFLDLTLEISVHHQSGNIHMVEVQTEVFRKALERVNLGPELKRLYKEVQLLFNTPTQISKSKSEFLKKQSSQENCSFGFNLHLNLIDFIFTNILK